MTLTMRALTIDAHGGLDQLRLRDDLPAPLLVNPDDVRVRVHAAALNRLDWWVLNGIPGVKIHPGWVLGSDGAGVVESVGSAVRDLAVGDRVLWGVGVDPNIIRASLKAVVSAVNRSIGRPAA